MRNTPRIKRNGAAKAGAVVGIAAIIGLGGYALARRAHADKGESPPIDDEVPSIEQTPADGPIPSTVTVPATPGIPSVPGDNSEVVQTPTPQPRIVMSPPVITPSGEVIVDYGVTDPNTQQKTTIARKVIPQQRRSSVVVIGTRDVMRPGDLGVRGKPLPKGARALREPTVVAVITDSTGRSRTVAGSAAMIKRLKDNYAKSAAARAQPKPRPTIKVVEARGVLPVGSTGVRGKPLPKGAAATKRGTVTAKISTKDGGVRMVAGSPALIARLKKNLGVE